MAENTNKTGRDKDKTAVIFRRWRNGNGGGIIALFPEIPTDTTGYYIMSYERVGHHGAAAYDGIIARSTPASKRECRGLAQELESIGYNLSVYRHQTIKMRVVCMKTARQ